MPTENIVKSDRRRGRPKTIVTEEDILNKKARLKKYQQERADRRKEEEFKLREYERKLKNGELIEVRKI